MQMDEARSISIIVPALNEEKNILSVISGLIGIFEPGDIRYEVLLFDDGSTDHTYQIAISCASENKNVRVFKNETNKGIGYCFKEGIKHSHCHYVTYFPGDNQNYPDDLYRLSLYIPKAEIIIGIPRYKLNERTLFRRVISKIVTGVFTIFISMKFTHLTNMAIYAKSLINSFDIKSDGFMFQIEVLLKAFRAAKSLIFSEERVKIKPRMYGRAKAISLKSLFESLYLFCDLIIEFYLTKRGQFKSQPKLLTG